MIRSVFSLPTSNKEVDKIELFFDLVFVFTFIQLTLKLEHHLDFLTFIETVVLMALIWYIFEGFIWLTNTTELTSKNYRIFLVLGMSGFMLISVSIPLAFARDGFIFALGYLIVVSTHALLFVSHSNEDTRRAIIGIVPYNIMFAIGLLVASLFDSPVRLIAWGLIAIIAIVGPLLQRNKGSFHVSPSHFLERHYLVLVIALGETIASTGRAVIDETLTPDVLMAMLLCLALTVLLWISYVSKDHQREQAFQQLDDQKRDQIAKISFFTSHFLMFFGIVLLAVVMIAVIHSPLAPLHHPERLVFLGGMILFSSGIVYFNRLFLSFSLRRFLLFIATQIILFLVYFTPAILLLLISCITYYLFIFDLKKLKKSHNILIY